MNGNYSAARPAGREHVPAYPKGFIAIRIVQLVIAVIIVGLSAFGLSEIIITGSELSIFTVCLSLVVDEKKSSIPPNTLLTLSCAPGHCNNDHYHLLYCRRVQP